MIRDYEMELTVDGGHDVSDIGNNATVYGSRPYDLKAAGVNVALGEPLTFLGQVLTADVDTATSIAFTLVTDTDGAGGTAVALHEPVVKAIADLQVADGVFYIATLPPGTAVKRYLTARMVSVGDPGGTGTIKLWIVKGSDALPYNAGWDTTAAP